MVVPNRWRDAYRDQRELAEKVKAEVDEHLRRIPHSWFVDSRIKEPDSFYEKVETGRYRDIDQLEDFFGAMIVVPLQSQIPVAIALVDEFFSTSYRRPAEDSRASQAATDFRFNDIRLYGKLRHDDALPAGPINEMIFEIQVKTFFQHAWSSATHDLVYKHPRFSWPRSRVAAQVKAMVESAELSMDSIDSLSASRVLPAEGTPESDLNSFLDIILENWDRSDLPSNLKRVTESIHQLCRALQIGSPELRVLYNRGRADLDGHPDGWSPYQCLVDYASRYEAASLKRLLRKSSGQPKVVHVTETVLTRLELTLEDCPRALLS